MSLILTRRSFFGLLAAPAIVRIGSLMPVATSVTYEDVMAQVVTDFVGYWGFLERLHQLPPPIMLLGKPMMLTGTVVPIRMPITSLDRGELFVMAT